jgi:general secretion pathway protein D
MNMFDFSQPTTAQRYRISTFKRAVAVAVSCLMITGPLTQRAAVAQPAPGTAGAVPADDPIYTCNKKSGGRTTVGFKPETELKDLITWAMGFTCKNFIFEPRIVATGKKVTVISPNKMTSGEAYAVFLVALSTMGLTVVPKGNLLRIVESPSAKSETLPLYVGRLPPATDEMVRYVMKSQYLPVETLRQAMDSIRSPAGVVNTVGSVLVVTDYASQIRDMATLAKSIDLPGTNESIYTISVNYADATKLAQQINEILGIQAAAANGGAAAGKGGGKATRAGEEPSASDVAAAVPSKILVDDRTNTLIVVASEAGYLRVKALVDRIDIDLQIEGGGSLHVYKLENGLAEDLATTLNSALQSRSAGAATATTRGGAAPAPGGAGGLAGASLEGQVRVVGDKASNALLVTSSGRDFFALRDIVRQLDQPRRQVFIEAAILEVQLGNDNKLGASSHGGIPKAAGILPEGLVLGGVQTADLKSLDLSTLISASGLIGGIVGSPLASSEVLLGKSIPSYGVLFQALATSANTNILSAPHFIAINNEKTEFEVGTNIPYKGAITSLGGLGGAAGAGLNQSIQREPLTLKLNVTPRISSGDTLRLEIDADIKDIGERDPELGPTWTTRKLKTQVVIRDQQTVVLGGLISERTIYNESKVPLLGDIPILGYLFKVRNKQKKRSNLLIMLTPYLIKDQLDLQEIRERKERERQEFVRSFDNLDDKYYRHDIDYRRKRGVVEEINRVVQAIEEDEESLRSLNRGQRVEEGPLKYKVDANEDDDGAPAAKPAASSTTPVPQTMGSGSVVVPVIESDDALTPAPDKTKPSKTPKTGATGKTAKAKAGTR